VLAGILVALPLLLLAGSQISQLRLNAELARLRRAGEHLNLSELVPKVGPGEANAAPLYEQAFAMAPKDMISPAGSKRAWDTTEIARVKRLAAEHLRYFALVEQASRVPTCAFPKDWGLAADLEFPELARFREAARILEARSEVEWREGRVDDAAQSCLVSLRIADHSDQDPGMLGHLVSVAIQAVSVGELSHVFSAGDPSPATCRALYGQLGKRTRLDQVAAAMKSERAWGLTAFDKMMKPDSASNQAKSYPAFWRLLMHEDELCYLHTMERNIKSMGKPYRQARAEMQATLDTVEHLPRFCFIISQMMTPAGARFLSSAYRHLALAGAAQIAAAAKGYKGAHGRYPTSLGELARDGWDLPSDPFTRAPYHYAREGSGIAVWSVGPDMTDNHGLDWNYRANKIEDEAGYRPGYDYVFRCSQ